MAAKSTKKAKPDPAGIEVVDGHISGGRRFLFYGQEGVGKTTLAAHAPNPILIDIENGSKNLSVARFKFPDGTVVPKTLQQVTDAIRKLSQVKHPFESVVIDALDRLERLIHLHCMERDSGRSSNLNKYGKQLESIESYGYGKGYQVASEVMSELLNELEILIERTGMNVVFIAHSKISTFKDPEGEDYDRYWIRAHPHVAGKIREWVDVCGFCCFESGGGKLDEDQNRAKGWSTGRRLLKLQHSHAYDAKSRVPMPDEIELLPENPWAPIQEAIDGAEQTPAAILKSIQVECARLGDDELTAKVRKACTGSKDSARLSRYLMDLRNREPKEEATNV